jgi:hypothetical protein
MAWTDRYANFDLATGANDGTSEADAWQDIATMNAGMAAGGMRVWIKRQASRMFFGSGVTLGVAGVAATPNLLVGYATTPGDGGLWEVGATSFSNNILVPAHFIIENVDFDGTGGGLLRGNNTASPGTSAVRCRILAEGEIRFGFAHRCRFELAASGARLAGTATNNSGVTWTENILIGSGSTLLARPDVVGQEAHIVDNIFLGDGTSGSVGLELYRPAQGAHIVRGNIFHDFDADGLQVSEESSSPDGEYSIVDGNLFSTCGGYGVKKPATTYGQWRLRNNFHYLCTSGLTDYTEELVYGSVALSADPFEDAASGDLRINDAAGGGALIRAAQFDMTAAMPFRPLGPFLKQLAGGGSPVTTAHF